VSKELHDLIEDLSNDIGNSTSARVIVPLCHIYLEHFMNRVLEQNLPAVEYQRILTDKHFGFKRKLDRLHDMELLSDDEHTDLDLINDTRNDFVHEFKPDLQIINDRIFAGLHFHVFNAKRNPVEAILYDMVQLMELLGSKLRH